MVKEASSILVGVFFALPLVVVALLFLALRRSAMVAVDAAGSADERRAAVRTAVVTLVWLALTAGAARTGRLSFTTVPPTMLIAVALGIVLVLRLGLSATGARIAATVPLAALVGAQAFRLPLELAMHRAWTEGLMPVQMSYSGLNFDIVTGATALILAIALAVPSLPAVWVHAWNVLGFVLLLNIVTIAILSAPLPIRVFMSEPANVWITSFPFIWLPTVLVPAALLGHILIWRRLAQDRSLARARPKSHPDSP
jgi:hypothetical protein